MNTLKKIIGFLLLASVLCGLVVVNCITYGTGVALLAWGISIVLTAIIVGGVHLLVD